MDPYVKRAQEAGRGGDADSAPALRVLDPLKIQTSGMSNKHDRWGEDRPAELPDPDVNSRRHCDPYPLSILKDMTAA